jgi:hypothetical protein
MYPPTHSRAGPAPGGDADAAVRTRYRSFCFLQRGEERWTAFLITYLRDDGQWRGYFNFRAAEGDTGTREIRTADLFVEETEEEVDQRARSLGRPLVLALLESALHTEERRRGPSPDLRRWFRDMLSRQAQSTGAPVAGAAAEGGADASLARLRTLYDSYRLDQVSHLITLVEPATFRELVEVLLDGRRIDFRGNDRLQLAMSVVQELERRLPLPPFEVWAEDYMARPEAYRRYAEWLHAGAGLPDLPERVTEPAKRV